MFFLVWNWIRGICRQKRFLLLLFTFGSSFILFNYSLLSSSSTLLFSPTTPAHQSQDLYLNNNHKHEGNAPYRNANHEKRKFSSKEISKFDITSEKFIIARSVTFGRGFAKLTRRNNESNEFSPVEPSKNDKTSNSNGVRTVGQRDTDLKTDYDSRLATSSPSIEPSSRYNKELISAPAPTLFPPIKNSDSRPSTTDSNHDINNTRHLSPDNNQFQPISPNSNSIPANDLASSSPFQIPTCNTPSHLRRVQKRKKNLTVIENFIVSGKRVKCDETVTYTTHGDYRYLDNLVPLVERWSGPISLAIYAPGTDLEKTLTIINYLKSCTSSKVDEWVTFHLIYDVKFNRRPPMPSISGKTGELIWLDKLYKESKWVNCSIKPNFNKFEHTFRTDNGLLYPINIARNIARSAATTLYVLASDIELYPSINLIPSFMKMLHRLKGKYLEKEAKEQDHNNSNNNKNPKHLIKSALTTVVTKLFFPHSISPGNISDDDNNDSDNFNKEENETSRRSNYNVQQSNIENKGQQQGPTRTNYGNRHVFVVPVFEVRKEVLPCQVETKEQLLTLLKKKAAIVFHHSICPQCHTIPKYEKWKIGKLSNDKNKLSMGKCDSGNETRSNNNAFPSYNLNSSPTTNVPLEMNIFYKAKRKFPYHLWEPIFIGTKNEPIYDERLSWEGLRDKMVSGFVMCSLDYDFYILDNAFLVHKPGIRRVIHLVTKTVLNQDRLINYRIRAELLRKFGRHEGCAL